MTDTAGPNGTATASMAAANTEPGDATIDRLASAGSDPADAATARPAPDRHTAPDAVAAERADGWRRGFAADAERHQRDAPRHCPQCGASLRGGAGITVEFWQGADRIFHTWCASCHWTGDIIPLTDMIGHEPEH